MLPMNVKQERRNSPVPLSRFHFVPLRTHAVTSTDRRGRQLRAHKQTTGRNGTEGFLIAVRAMRQRNTPICVSSCTLRQLEPAYIAVISGTVCRTDMKSPLRIAALGKLHDAFASNRFHPSELSNRMNSLTANKIKPHEGTCQTLSSELRSFRLWSAYQPVVKGLHSVKVLFHCLSIACFTSSTAMRRQNVKQKTGQRKHALKMLE
jgi:hypothetical protein